MRGSEKKIIYVKDTGSKIFEEAYFVMRRDVPQPDTDATDMLWEANRIIENTLPRVEPETVAVQHRIPQWVGRWLWFTLGSLFGSGAVGLLWWLL